MPGIPSNPPSFTTSQGGTKPLPYHPVKPKVAEDRIIAENPPADASALTEGEQAAPAAAPASKLSEPVPATIVLKDRPTAPTTEAAEASRPYRRLRTEKEAVVETSREALQETSNWEPVEPHPVDK